MSTKHEMALTVEGMTCPGCEQAVIAALAAVPGVDRASADLDAAAAAVSADDTVTPKALERALAKAGYRGRIRSAPGAPVPLRGSPRDPDLIVLGGGSAGFAAAIRAADEGAHVALVNGGVLGGTCVNVGCIPSKALIRAAEAHHRRHRHRFAGVPTTHTAPDWSRIREAKDELVEDLRQTKYRDVVAAHERITLHEHRGVVGADGQTVVVAGTTELRAARTIVTTGSVPRIAAIPGLAGTPYLDSTRAMALDTLPASLVVIGGGVVGMELGQMFSRLGTAVTILTRQPVVLPKEDPAVGASLTAYTAEEGVEIRTEVTVDRVEYDEGFTIFVSSPSGRARIPTEHLLVATGRRPVARGFGLEEAGVTFGARGEILTNEYYQTANPHIFAAGDVTGEPMYVYVAAYAGAVAAENALHGGAARPRDLSTVPRVTFTDPAAAVVGLTETAARDAGLRPIVTSLSLEQVPRSLAARDTRGFITLVADADTRRILGAHILAAEAGDLITEPTLAIRFGLTIDDLTSTFHPYLTLSEGIKLAAQTFDTDVARLSCCAA